MLGKCQGRVPVASTWVAQHAVANPPGCVGLGDFPQKELCKKRSGLQGEERRRRIAALPGRRSTPAGPPKSSGLHGPEPLDRVTMEIVLGRTRGKHEPGTSSSAAERAGAGPGAAPLPGPARSFFALGRAAPPRPAPPPPPPPSSPRASRALRRAQPAAEARARSSSRPGRRVALFPSRAAGI